MNEINLLDYSPVVAAILALNIIGLGIKQVPFISNKYIPLILPAIGAAVFLLLDGHIKYHGNPIVWELRLIYGIVAGGLAVWGHQIVTQIATPKPLPPLPPEPPQA